MAVEVAACDSISANCYSGQEGPYSWSATLTQAEIAALAPALAAGSIDFGYTWDSQLRQFRISFPQPATTLNTSMRARRRLT